MTKDPSFTLEMKPSIKVTSRETGTLTKSNRLKKGVHENLLFMVNKRSTRERE